MAKTTRTRAMIRSTPIEPEVVRRGLDGTPVPTRKDAGIYGGDSLQNLIAAIGTRRDKRSHSFYNFPLTLTRVEIENMFRSSWLAKRIVRTPADDMLRAWVDRTWDGSDEPGDTSAKAIAVAEKSFNVRGKVNEALVWGDLYGGAGIVFDIRGQDDWSKPLDVAKIQKGQLRSLHVLDRWRLAATGEIDYDRRSPNYGQPKFYTISDTGTPQYSVHWTRVVKFQGEPLPWFLWIQNAYWQDSVLQHIAEVIRDYDATMIATAALVYEASVDIITSPGLATALAAGGAAAAKVIDRYAAAGQLKSINHMLLLDGGPAGAQEKYAHETWQQKTTQFSGLKDVIEKFMINVCGAADIPMTRLFGQSPAGLTATGESDIRNYYDRLASNQERQLRPALERIDEVLFRSTLGKMPENYELSFRPLWQMTDKEQAEVEKLRAERDQIYLLQGVVQEHTVAGRLLDVGTYGGSLTKKDVQLVERMARMAAALPPPGTPGQVQPGGKKAPLAGRPTDPSAPAHKTPGELKALPAGDALLKMLQAFDVIRKKPDGYHLYSENGKKHLGGPYTKKELARRIAQVEWYRDH